LTLLNRLLAGVEEMGDEDAVNQPCIQKYLTEFLQSFSQQPYFQVFLQHLYEEKKQILASMGVET
jgi:hypothetical protein